MPHNAPEKRMDERYGIEQFAKTKDEFIEFYDGNLGGKLNQIEKERKDVAKLMVKRWVIVGALLPLVFIVNYLNGGVGNLAIIAWIVGAIYVSILNSKARNVIQIKLKKEIIGGLVKFMNPNFTYEPENYVSKREFIQSNIFHQQPNEYSGDDLIEGYIWDEEEQAMTNLSFSEVKAVSVTKRRTSKGQTEEVRETIFQGLFFKTEFNKDFGDSITIIVPKVSKFQNKITNFMGRLSVKMGGATQLDEVQLENPDFMDRFTVRSTDQIDARVILQADFMEKVLEFIDYKYEPLSGESTTSRQANYTPYFSFRDNEMYFLLSTGHTHFDFNVLAELNKVKVYEYFRDINRSLELIDELNLNFKLYQPNRKDVV